MGDLPADYLERVYAGVLGKAIGVYLGRPVEGWSNERIERELGEVGYYVHDRVGAPLVVTDDDLTGTFTFLRALPDNGNDAAIPATLIGETWLDYVVEGRTVLWWGGLGCSTEHTAYLRLKHGIEAPRSGSRELNGDVVAEQIGAEIFVDGWALVAPGDPELAADLARRAASVSHDGEAVHAACTIAAMEAHAFVEPDLDRLVETALAFAPPSSTVRRLLEDARDWRSADPDWRGGFARLQAAYPDDGFGGTCHVLPNYGRILLGLLYGDGDFGRSLAIVNTAGFDTDCNSGNLGCLLGIRGGLAAFAGGRDWRGPVADRLLLPTADGGRAVTDALQEAVRVAAVGAALAGRDAPAPGGGARYSFAFPGAVQGFETTSGDARLANPDGRGLELRLGSEPAEATTDTFVTPRNREQPGYALVASPSLHPGQTVTADLAAPATNPGAVHCGLVLRRYDGDDELVALYGPDATLTPGERRSLSWRVPDLGGQPVAAVGLRTGPAPGSSVLLERLTWDGEPRARLGRPAEGGSLWRSAWVDAVDEVNPLWPEPYRLVQNEGRGLLIQGAREWCDYAVDARLVPHLARAFGVAVRVQGLRRCYALLLTDEQTVRLVAVLRGETVLAEAPYAWSLGGEQVFRLEARGGTLRGRVGEVELTAEDAALDGGACALVVEEGSVSCLDVGVEPAE
ncbi:MAG TPA: ADP-ribosylglycohydrolase family protein [Gaiellaceae bacterium]|nr:ADP-ribosylglycohydrolase family protein [Gaiellaceae bacterium]